MKAPLKIALFIEQTSNHTQGIARGISLYAQTHGPWIFSSIIEQPNGRHLVASPTAAFTHLDSDGIIAYVRDENVLRELMTSGLPVVNTTQVPTVVPNLFSVYTDDRAAGRQVADYFIRRQFRNFAYCASQLELSSCSMQRGLGFAERIKAENLPFSSFPPMDKPSRDIVWEKDSEQVAKWIASQERPLAVFADNDSCGRIIADICLNQGIHVPEEVAIVGVDDNQLICEFSNPYLSSIPLAKEQVGFEAAALLEKIIRGKKLPENPVLIPPLSITTRRSSDIFAVKDPHVAKALNFIYTHAGDSIQVADVLKTVPLCRRHLENRFRQTIGRTPYEEIRRAHIERAKKLLAETNLPVEQIVEASGFNETKNFYANFKKETGSSPIQYRKQFKIIAKK